MGVQFVLEYDMTQPITKIAFVARHLRRKYGTEPIHGWGPFYEAADAPGFIWDKDPAAMRGLVSRHTAGRTTQKAPKLFGYDFQGNRWVYPFSDEVKTRIRTVRSARTRTINRIDRELAEGVITKWAATRRKNNAERETTLILEQLGL